MVLANPDMIRSAAPAIVCRPEEQKRFTVWAGTLDGSPALSAASRATFSPCGPSGTAQPRMTSSTSAGSSPSARSTASAMAAAAMSSGRVARKVPFGARPTAVRAPATITASFIDDPPSPSWSVPQRLPGGEQVLDALHGRLLAQQLDERLPLEREDVLLFDPLRLGQLAAAEHAGELGADQHVVLAGQAAPLHGAHAQLQRGQGRQARRVHRALRSEEHTSELQSRRDLVCRLLLEKKKKKRGPPDDREVHLCKA